MPLLEVKNLKKEFALETSGKYTLFQDISFNFEDNENFLSVLAPFGTGKTTLMKIIAGLEIPSGGKIYLQNSHFDHPDGRIIYIPEEPSSLPWFNVIENITEGIESSSFKINVNEAKIKEILKITGLEGYENHITENKISGFRFRVVLGRALIFNPALILIDDSLKYLDNIVKNELFDILNDINIRTGIKFLIASSDVSTVARLSDRIIFLKGQPAEIAGEFKPENDRGKRDLNNFIKVVESIYLGDNLNNPINVTI